MFRFLAVVFLVLPLFGGMAQGQSLPKAYKPHTMEEAKAAAPVEKKKILYMYTQRDCPPCSYVMGALAREDMRKVYQPNFLMVELYYQSEEGRKAWESHGVRASPVLSFLTAKAELICWSSGFNIPEEGIAMAKLVLAADKPLDGPLASRTCERLKAVQK
jgi:thioredoxin-related protein